MSNTSEGPKVSRRRFLGFGVGAAAGTALGIPAGRTLSDFVAAVDHPIRPPGGPEDHVLSVCNLCPGGCGLRVRRVGRRAVKVNGNPLHPVNGGRLCPKGQAALQGLYHPDRLTGPLRRVGSKGSIDSFEPTSWEEALGAIAERLKLLRRGGRPESAALIGPTPTSLAIRLANHFMQAFGSPNNLFLDRGDEAAALALLLGQGVRAVPSYDLAAADYILCFGGALLEAWNSPVHTMRAYGLFRQGRPGRRGKLVQVEPRLSITAASADEWISVHPGTEGILALGVAQALVAEGLQDRYFVRKRTHNFESLRNFLVQEYNLEKVSAATGASADMILRLAREFGAAQAPVAVGPRKGPLLPGSLFDHLAVQALNALVGNLDQPGGLLMAEEMPLASFPPPGQDPLAESGLNRPRLDQAGGAQAPHLRTDPEALAEAILASSPYPLEILIVQGTDPVHASASPDRMARAFEKIPMVVSVSCLPTDTALLADWILPESHFLESWDLYTTPAGVPYSVASLARPAVDEPLHDTRPSGEIYLELARRIGGPVAAALPWKDLLTLIRTEVESIYEARRGAIMGTSFDEAWVRMMERAGWWEPGYGTAEELWEQMNARGGWWDPFYDHGDWGRVLRTSTGRYEFQVDLLREWSKEKRKDFSLPTHFDQSNSSLAGPETSLALILFEPLPIAGGVGAELPFLPELLDPGHEARWETWVELHPETAQQIGIKDRARVRVVSDRGAIEARARVTERVVAGAAAIPVGLGKQAGGRWASGVGANPFRLLAPARDPGSRLPDFGSTRVRISAQGGSDRG